MNIHFNSLDIHCNGYSQIFFENLLTNRILGVETVSLSTISTNYNHYNYGGKTVNICVYGASSNKISPVFIQAGERLGEIMAAGGHTLVFGGGANGMMGAVARGMSRGGGRIIGVAPTFFNVDGVLYEKCDELVGTETMRERKQIMEDRSDAFIMTAGGIGTFEEFFEILTLRQLGRHQKAVAVLNTHGYFDSMIQMLEHSVEQNFLAPENLSLFALCDTPEQAVAYIETYVAREDSIQKLRNL